MYYSGTFLDLYIPFAPFADNDANEFNGLVTLTYPAALAYAVVDLPFSFAADTITTPYNYYILSHCYVTEDGETYSRWDKHSKYRICSTRRIDKRRNEFQKLYDQKDFAQARAQLEPIVSTCSGRVNSTTLGWLRNDLALTMYNLGDYAGCLNVLQPLQEFVDETEKASSSKYVSMYGPQFGPKVADDDRRLAKATRVNLKLCNRVP